MSKQLKSKTEEIKTLLVNDRSILEMAIVAIFERQTASEKSAFTTNQNNGVGFAGCDSISGTVMANYILKGIKSYGKRYGQNLSGKWVEKALKMMPKYAGQLARIELEKGNQAEDLEPEPDDRGARHDAVMRPNCRLYQNEDGEQEWEAVNHGYEDA